MINPSDGNDKISKGKALAFLVGAVIVCWYLIHHFVGSLF